MFSHPPFALHPFVASRRSGSPARFATLDNDFGAASTLAKNVLDSEIQISEDSVYFSDR
jgi:hypothetical protein